jgi:integrase
VLNLEEISDSHVELFYKHLNFDLKLSTTTYNRYMVIMKTFYNWCIDVKEVKSKNPFAKAELVFTRQEKNVVNKSEFEKLLETITYENGFAPKHGETRNYYRPWLVNAYRLALETGERAEPIVRLKWSDIIEVDGGVEMFRISNLKINRIRTGQETGKYVRYIPVTRSLKALLVELGYNEKQGSDECVLKTDAGESTAYTMQLITRSFSHYVAKAGLRHIVFKDLRKTYISSLSIAMGASAKMYTGHADSRVVEHHYLSQSFLTSKLKDFDVL